MCGIGKQGKMPDTYEVIAALVEVLDFESILWNFVTEDTNEDLV